MPRQRKFFISAIGLLLVLTGCDDTPRHDVDCYSSGTLIYSAKAVHVVASGNGYDIYPSEGPPTTVTGNCVIKPAAKRAEKGAE